MGNGKADIRPGNDRLMCRWHAKRSQDYTGRTECDCRRAEQIGIRMGFKKSNLAGKAVWITEIIAIHTGDVSAACPINDLVEPRSKPQAQSILDQPDPGVAETRNHPNRFIARTIVYDDELEVPVTLSKDRPDRGAHRTGVVVHGHGDRYERTGYPQFRGHDRTSSPATRTHYRCEPPLAASSLRGSAGVQP